jgi:RND family efflux transporter MFP subunit
VSKLSSITHSIKALIAMAVLVAFSVVPIHSQDVQDDDHDHEEESHQNETVDTADEHAGDHDDHEEEGLVSLSPSQLAIAGIVVKAVSFENLSLQLSAPGEVVNNEYRTTHIAPKITAQVVDRLVVLGEEVEEGRPLLTLYSVDLLRTQSSLLVAHREWLRVSELGEQTVGARRFTEARAAFEELYSEAGAYGMSETEIEDSLIGRHDDHELGEFDLLAPHNGVVLSDDFSIGQTIAAGQTLLTLVDESSVWVEASLPPDIGFRLPEDTSVLINVQGSTFVGQIIQQSHVINESTRTWKVRTLVENSDHTLHAGLFADVLFTTRSESRGIVVPDSALMRVSDGDWTVFIEEELGQFMQTEVEIVQSFPGSKAINGLQANTRIAVEGAFFIASEMAKSGFDPHDH